jgi:hypothetical protein
LNTATSWRRFNVIIRGFILLDPVEQAAAPDQHSPPHVNGRKSRTIAHTTGDEVANMRFAASKFDCNFGNR